MILRIAKNSRTADSDLRESYRQRLNEIYESGRTGGGSPEPLLEPVTPAVPLTARVDLDLPVLVRTDDSVPQPAPRQPSPPPEVVAPEPANCVEENPAGATDALGQAAERVAQSLTQGLLAIMNGQERRRSADAARLDERLAALHQMLQSQAELIASLGSANDGMLRNQQAVQQRLDNQADVIRELTSAAKVQQNRWSEYRSAVEKLKEITNLPNLPVRLPDNL